MCLKKFCVQAKGGPSPSAPPKYATDSDIDENRAGCSYIDKEKKLNDTATVTSADTAVTQLTVIYANISMW